LTKLTHLNGFYRAQISDDLTEATGRALAAKNQESHESHAKRGRGLYLQDVRASLRAPVEFPTISKSETNHNHGRNTACRTARPIAR
jgi:hypothetical protein